MFYNTLKIKGFVIIYTLPGIKSSAAQFNNKEREKDVHVGATISGACHIDLFGPCLEFSDRDDSFSRATLSSSNDIGTKNSGTKPTGSQTVS